MVKVDSKGRVVLPYEVRERLGITPGTEVAVRADDGRAVVVPEADPNRIIEDLAGLVDAASRRREQRPYDELDVESRRHVDTIRRQAGRTEPE